MKRLTLFFCLMVAVILVTVDLPSQVTDKEIFARLGEADMLARSGKKQEEALKAYIALLEECHRLELRSVGPVVLNLCMFSESYPPARDKLVWYLRGWVNKARSGRLSPLQMSPLDAMAELTKREDVLVDAFVHVMAAQNTAEQKQAWGQVSFKAMVRAERYADLHRHFDMVGVAQAQVEKWKKKKNSGNGSMGSMFVGVMSSDFNTFLDVYRKMGDQDGAAKMMGLIRQLEEGEMDGSDRSDQSDGSGLLDTEIMASAGNPNPRS
jgi:hypothetical protein